ncbi:hypothetical protein HYN86_09820 [Flavobacterium fluviale]|uniref:Uncharacterized protein n=1 Tax=Flavobacterium fluviale TaxID=2249356 RepID=A0A344LSI0_9FLAO|nr:hypothetical protein HYN86_09820 [Flavobacterium fluviale]
MEITEIKSNSKKRVKLEKPDFSLLKEINLLKPAMVLFLCKMVATNTFDLIQFITCRVIK